MEKLLSILLVVVLLGSLVGVILAYEGLKDLTEYESVTFKVQPGDTLWKVASYVNDGSYNVHKIIFHIKELNGIGSMVRAGNVVKVPNISNKSKLELESSGFIVVNTKKGVK